MQYNSNNIPTQINEEEERQNKSSYNDQSQLGFNTRRASEMNNFDYLKPTLASMQRAKSVAPKNKGVVG